MVKLLVNRIINSLNLNDSLFTKEELIDEYIEQIVEKDCKSLVDYLKSLDLLGLAEEVILLSK